MILKSKSRFRRIRIAKQKKKIKKKRSNLNKTKDELQLAKIFVNLFTWNIFHKEKDINSMKTVLRKKKKVIQIYEYKFNQLSKMCIKCMLFEE